MYVNTVYLDRGISELKKYGTIKIHLVKLLKERGLSKNKLSHRAEMLRTQINRYCK